MSKDVIEFVNQWGFGGMFFIIALLLTLGLQQLRRSVDNLGAKLDTLVEVLLTGQVKDKEHAAEPSALLRLWPRLHRGDD